MMKLLCTDIFPEVKEFDRGYILEFNDTNNKLCAYHWGIVIKTAERWQDILVLHLCIYKGIVNILIEKMSNIKSKKEYIRRVGTIQLSDEAIEYAIKEAELINCGIKKWKYDNFNNNCQDFIQQVSNKYLLTTRDKYAIAILGTLFLGPIYTFGVLIPLKLFRG